jgi:methylmalonyl-CoA/ethylmalonyl-CoA epimerase
MLSSETNALSLPWAFHHIGLACRKIEPELAELGRLGYSAETAVIHDPVQKVRVQFASGPGPRIELIEPTDASSPVEGVLARGTKLYHLGYESAAFDHCLALLQQERFRLVAPVSSAVAFGMRRIAFLLSPNINLVELIEGPSITAPDR